MKPILNLSLFLSFCTTVTLQSQPSRIELHTMSSTLLGTEMSFNVFLPTDYDSSTDHYPVVYLFRGAVDEWADPTEDASRRGNIKTVVDTLYQSGAVGKMILIMPGLSQPATDADLMYTVQELIPYVDQHFRTIPTRWQRGIDGFSYGGLSTIRLLLSYPESFSSVGSYDGSLFLIDPNSYSFSNQAYLAKVKPIQMLIHSAVVSPNNYLVNQEFVDTLASYGIQNAFQDIRLAPNAAHNWYYADLHMSITLPLHWKKFLQSRANVQVQVLAPSFEGKLSGNIQLQWSLTNAPTRYETILEYSRNAGRSWNTLFTSANPDSTFLWNTATVPDGTRYLLRVEVAGDTSYGIFQTANCFTIDNPGNGAPDLEVYAPQAGAIAAGDCPVSWLGQDADGDSLAISLDASFDNGVSWETIATALPNVSPHILDTRFLPNSDRVRIRIRCWDGTTWSSGITGKFSIRNPRTTLSNSNVQHVQGPGDGVVTIKVVNAGALTGHLYRLTIDDTSVNSKTYDVVDLNSNTVLVTHAPGIGTQTEGPLFDGVRLVISDFDPPTVNVDSTKWVVGGSDLTARVILPSLVSGNGIPYPADYEIRIADHVVDTSSSLMFSTPTPMLFSVWNVTESRKATIMFNDNDNNHQVSPGDDFMILENIASGAVVITWDVVFDAKTSYRAPVAGDVMRIRVMKPLTSRDVFEFSTFITSVASQSETPVSFYLSQNYPNPFNPNTTIAYGLPEASSVHLSIYDILGRQVVELFDGNQKAGRHQLLWTATVSSGIYFVRLEAVSLSVGGARFVSVKKMLLVK